MKYNARGEVGSNLIVNFDHFISSIDRRTAHELDEAKCLLIMLLLKYNSLFTFHGKNRRMFKILDTYFTVHSRELLEHKIV